MNDDGEFDRKKVRHGKGVASRSQPESRHVAENESQTADSGSLILHPSSTL